MHILQISKLKDTITEKESSSHREIEKVTSLADRENWELRRALDKLNNSHDSQLSKLQEAHNEELGKKLKCNVLYKFSSLFFRL